MQCVHIALLVDAAGGAGPKKQALEITHVLARMPCTCHMHGCNYIHRKVKARGAVTQAGGERIWHGPSGCPRRSHTCMW